ncbi:MAG TPA: M10 family metallopeptidase C-terminal domain-containing protein, partial [Pseudolabrys sp.]|nr:M10 family metallopeptidase C-terminal domain-containing protein [Pseudolabrys sp.]
SLSSGFITFSHFDDGSFDYTVSDPDSLSDTGHVTVSKQSGNTLNGSSVSEILIGNSEANTLNGGGGADILIGNGGDDTFVFKSVTDSQPGAGHYDTINDFAAGADHIDLTAITGATNIQDLAQGNTLAAHSVGWLVDSAHDQTIVYVNTTDTAETPGHTDMEIHLVGTNIDLSNAFLLHHS